MSSLSSKSAQDISELLDEYGIKHGPVVDSTRSLYERKLKEAMAKGKRAKPSPDKTFYREEEEVTYEYRTPVRSDGAGESWSYMRSRPEWNERESAHETSYSSISRSKPEYRGRDLVDETSYSTYSKSKPEYRGRDDETSYSSISRSKPEYRGRDLVDETSYSTYSSSKPEYRGRDLADEPHMYDTPSTYRSSYLKSPPMKPQEAPKAPKSSRLIPLWIQFVFFIAVAVFLYLVFSSMETNESIKGIEGL